MCDEQIMYDLSYSIGFKTHYTTLLGVSVKKDLSNHMNDLAPDFLLDVMCFLYCSPNFNEWAVNC